MRELFHESYDLLVGAVGFQPLAVGLCWLLGLSTVGQGMWTSPASFLTEAEWPTPEGIVAVVIDPSPFE